jgi:hypothetical protein
MITRRIEQLTKEAAVVGFLDRNRAERAESMGLL